MPTLAELQEKRNTLFGEMKTLREDFKTNGDKWKDYRASGDGPVSTWRGDPFRGPRPGKPLKFKRFRVNILYRPRLNARPIDAVAEAGTVCAGHRLSPMLRRIPSPACPVLPRPARRPITHAGPRWHGTGSAARGMRHFLKLPSPLNFTSLALLTAGLTRRLTPSNGDGGSDARRPCRSLLTPVPDSQPGRTSDVLQRHAGDAHLRRRAEFFALLLLARFGLPWLIGHVAERIPAEQRRAAGDLSGHPRCLRRLDLVAARVCLRTPQEPVRVRLGHRPRRVVTARIRRAFRRGPLRLVVGRAAFAQPHSLLPVQSRLASTAHASSTRPPQRPPRRPRPLPGRRLRHRPRGRRPCARRPARRRVVTASGRNPRGRGPSLGARPARRHC